MRIASASVCLLIAVATFVPTEQTNKDQLIGRPDGHEHYEPPLIGRPDGHELYDKHLIGKPDGHEFGAHSSESSEDSDSSDEDPEAEEGPEAEEEPLVRCKRPLCDVYCEYGFKKDSTGCPICECLDAADSSLIGRPDGHEAPPPCAGRPMCRMYCEFGFKRDEDGCEICSCLADPCQNVNCDPGLQCKSVPCDSLRSCTKLSAKCVASSSGMACAEPMCANYCPDGYQYNDNGCMTCNCVVPRARASEVRGQQGCLGPQPMCANACPGGYKYKPDGCMTCECAEEPMPEELLPNECLGSEHCDEGLVCRNRTVKGVTRAACTVKTLCETERDKPVALGASGVDCEPDGSFKPLQCNAGHSRCWCVDGLGHEVPKTRTSVYVDYHKPNCVRNVTVSMHIRMLMVVEHHIDITKLDSLHSLIVDHVSSWLLIDSHYVSVVKTEAKRSNSNEEIEEEARIVVVEVVVVHDGVTDLPSASEHMKRRMHKGLCRIPVKGGGSLNPDPRSVNVHHKFATYRSTTPAVIVDYEYHRGHGHTIFRMAFVSVAAVVFTAIFIAVICTVVRRKRNKLAAQFKHQILPSPTVSEKNLLYNDNVAEPVAVATEHVIKEKEPIA